MQVETFEVVESVLSFHLSWMPVYMSWCVAFGIDGMATDYRPSNVTTQISFHHDSKAKKRFPKLSLKFSRRFWLTHKQIKFEL